MLGEHVAINFDGFGDGDTRAARVWAARVSPSNAGEGSLLESEREPAVDGLVRSAVHLGVWVHEEVQRWPLLSRGQGQVATTAELQPILVVVPEEVISFRRVLRRLAAVYRHPAPPFHVKLGPAVVTWDFT